MNPRSLILLFVLLLVSRGAAADQIRFKDGSSFTGKVVKKTADEVVVQFDFGTMNFKPDEIEIIPEEDKPMPVPEKLPPAATPAVADEKPKEENKSQPLPVPAEAAAETTLPQAMQAVAYIKVTTQEGQELVGSGAVINSRGTMLTNNHVVQDAAKIVVTLYQEKKSSFSEREYEARVIRTFKHYDLAIIDIHADTPNFLRLADNASVRVGEEVKAIGNPLGLQVSISKGIVSGIRKNSAKAMPEMKEGEYISEREWSSITWIQTDASINPGNSGGPLLNSKNEIIGLNTFGFQVAGDMGLNFALHVKHLRQLAGGYKE